MDQLNNIDVAIFYFLNGHHARWLDGIMWYSSQMWTWVPVYILLLYLLFKKFPDTQFLLVLLGLATIIIFCDRVSVELVKNTVQRLRPSHQPVVRDKVLLLLDNKGNPYRGGLYGFFSNHASNYSGIATYFYFLMRPMRKWTILLLAVWVLLICYSRIYLGVHYPGDILAGILFGCICGYLIAQLFFYISRKKLFNP